MLGSGGSRLSVRDLVPTGLLQAQLVTISACRSAGARQYHSEGLVGLAWGFLSAGARHVVAGLWDVPDRSTGELMERMHAELARGARPAEALRAAQLSLAQRPGAWGNAVLLGGLSGLRRGWTGGGEPHNPGHPAAKKTTARLKRWRASSHGPGPRRQRATGQYATSRGKTTMHAEAGSATDIPAITLSEILQAIPRLQPLARLWTRD